MKTRPRQDQAPQAGDCPPWCTREHSASDHPDDRHHLDDGAIIPAVVRNPRENSVRSTEFVVQRIRYREDTHDWVQICTTEDRSIHLTLSAETGDRLAHALLPPPPIHSD